MKNRHPQILQLLLVLVALSTTSSVMAQQFTRRGFSFGADRDTLLYIIASPFDNWYLSVGGGIHTYFGNEQDDPARWNQPDLHMNFEIGKWVIPDVAVSLRFSPYNIHSQSCYLGRNPWIDRSGSPTYVSPELGHVYYPQSMHGFLAFGIVTFDWTNFLHGYEIGKRRHLHVFTPVGMGGVWLYGRQINNTASTAETADEMRFNRELGFLGGLMFEYITTKHISLNFSTELIGTKGTIDWTYTKDLANAPHPDRSIDWIPSIYLSIKFNLLKQVTKYNIHEQEYRRERVNHEFISFGDRNTVPRLEVRIDKLHEHIDSVQNLSDQRGEVDSVKIADMTAELDSLQAQLDSVIMQPYNRPPSNIIEDILRANEDLNLPATIIYYPLDRYSIDYNGHRRLQNFAKEMGKTDDTIEYYIIGAADSLTGTIRHNIWLSERRCEAAFNTLTKTYGADPNRLITIPVGGITEWDPQENNRMALLIRRSPYIDTIIEKWMRQGYGGVRR